MTDCKACRYLLRFSKLILSVSFHPSVSLYGALSANISVWFSKGDRNDCTNTVLGDKQKNNIWPVGVWTASDGRSRDWMKTIIKYALAREQLCNSDELTGLQAPQLLFVVQRVGTLGKAFHEWVISRMRWARMVGRTQCFWSGLMFACVCARNSGLKVKHHPCSFRGLHCISSTTPY